MRINALPNALGNALFPFGAEAQGGGYYPPPESPRGGYYPLYPPLNTRLYAGADKLKIPGGGNNLGAREALAIFAPP